jgi:hypothetical protein
MDYRPLDYEEQKQAAVFDSSKNIDAQTFISRTLNHLHQTQGIARGIERYLEVGIKKGQHFFNVEAHHKVGVLPDAKFDVRSRLPDTVEPDAVENNKIEIFETLSQDYFLHFYDDQKFDVICLNNARHLDALFQEFNTTLLCAHQNTIWLINGSMPRDLFDTLPSYHDACHLRKKMTGVEDWSWNGQVYQFILALHDFFPLMHYFTMSEGKNHQTIIWFEPRQDFLPRFNSFETIAKATYKDYLTHQDLYNVIPLEEAYAKLTQLAQRPLK